ncbi:unnamed protein product [Timema podura]|uniref:Peptidase S1 domain-containing protein n=1 Tax=Timema podura TaxID=61482 RepID=A0ABN7P5I0_TIMPD|nr:unnamed protein product [Timema podura]
MLKWRVLTDFIVVAGTSTLDHGGEKYSVIRRINHRDYRPSDSWRNDISLLRVDRQIVYSQFINSIPLAVPNQNLPVGLHTTASGWGYVDSRRTTRPNILQTIDVQVVSSEYCQEVHNKSIHSVHICAYGGEGYGVCSVTKYLADDDFPEEYGYYEEVFEGDEEAQSRHDQRTTN